MTAERQNSRLTEIQRGDTITADPFLNSIVRAVNGAQGRFSAPNQVAAPVEFSTIAPTEIWREVTRTTATERVFDPNDETVFVDVLRITSVGMRRPDGTVVLLVFN